MNSELTRVKSEFTGYIGAVYRFMYDYPFQDSSYPQLIEKEGPLIIEGIPFQTEEQKDEEIIVKVTGKLLDNYLHLPTELRRKVLFAEQFLIYYDAPREGEAWPLAERFDREISALITKVDVCFKEIRRALKHWDGFFDSQQFPLTFPAIHNEFFPRGIPEKDCFPHLLTHALLASPFAPTSLGYMRVPPNIVRLVEWIRELGFQALLRGFRELPPEKNKDVAKVSAAALAILWHRYAAFGNEREPVLFRDVVITWITENRLTLFESIHRVVFEHWPAVQGALIPRFQKFRRKETFLDCLASCRVQDLGTRLNVRFLRLTLEALLAAFKKSNSVSERIACAVADDLERDLSRLDPVSRSWIASFQILSNYQGLSPTERGALLAMIHARGDFEVELPDFQSFSALVREQNFTESLECIQKCLCTILGRENIEWTEIDVQELLSDPQLFSFLVYLQKRLTWNLIQWYAIFTSFIPVPISEEFSEEDRRARLSVRFTISRIFEFFQANPDLQVAPASSFPSGILALIQALQRNWNYKFQDPSREKEEEKMEDEQFSTDIVDVTTPRAVENSRRTSEKEEKEIEPRPSSIPTDFGFLFLSFEAPELARESSNSPLVVDVATVRALEPFRDKAQGDTIIREFFQMLPSSLTQGQVQTLLRRRVFDAQNYLFMREFLDDLQAPDAPLVWHVLTSSFPLDVMPEFQQREGVLRTTERLQERFSLSNKQRFDLYLELLDLKVTGREMVFNQAVAFAEELQEICPYYLTPDIFFDLLRRHPETLPFHALERFKEAKDSFTREELAQPQLPPTKVASCMGAIEEICSIFEVGKKETVHVALSASMGEFQPLEDAILSMFFEETHLGTHEGWFKLTSQGFLYFHSYLDPERNPQLYMALYHPLQRSSEGAFVSFPKIEKDLSSLRERLKTLFYNPKKKTKSTGFDPHIEQARTAYRLFFWPKSMRRPPAIDLIEVAARGKIYPIERGSLVPSFLMATKKVYYQPHASFEFIKKCRTELFKEQIDNPQNLGLNLIVNGYRGEKSIPLFITSKTKEGTSLVTFFGSATGFPWLITGAMFDDPERFQAMFDFLYLTVLAHAYQLEVFNHPRA